MNMSQSQRARALFGRMLETPPMQHESILVSEDDPEVVQEVRRLLSRHFESGVVAPPHPAALQGEPTVGDRLGPYELVKRIGAGGFGVVFEAKRTQPHVQNVALKILHSGQATRSMLARFEQERQTLAFMDHPGIAKIFDSGVTGGGRPYFVMELVRGEPITEYCKRTTLDLPGQLQLFMHVCEAVHHAHMKGVIHRDLKPDNILVAEHNDRPLPKVIDFGIAKVLAQGMMGSSVRTIAGEFLVTPEYMSPEQAEGVDIDIRSDVYALGVVLYELVTGLLPIDSDRLRASTLQEMLRLVIEHIPTRPSAASGDERLKPEIDWIVLKCLEKDRKHRYDSASDLAKDLRHFLADEPVMPPQMYTVLDRLSRTARRHRVAIGTGSMVAFILLASTVVSLGFGMAATKRSNDLNALVGQYAELAEDLWRNGEPELVIEQIGPILATLEQRGLGDQPPGLKIKLHLANALKWANDLDGAERLYNESIASWARRGMAAEPQVQALRFNLALLHVARGKRSEEPQEKRTHYERALKGMEVLLGMPTDGATSLAVESEVANLHRMLGDTERAMAMYDRVLDRMEREGTAEPFRFAETLANSALVVSAMGDHEAAARRLATAYEQYRDLRGATFGQTISVGEALAREWLRAGRQQEAASVLMRMFADLSLEPVPQREKLAAIAYTLANIHIDVADSEGARIWEERAAHWSGVAERSGTSS